MDMKVICMATNMFFGWDERDTNMVIDFMKMLSKNRWNMSIKDFAALRVKYPKKNKNEK